METEINNIYLYIPRKNNKIFKENNTILSL